MSERGNYNTCLLNEIGDVLNNKGLYGPYSPFAPGIEARGVGRCQSDV
jgi:hypothetical protein